MLRGATIGCGFFGRIQLEAWARVDGARVEAVCDLDEARARAVANEFGLRAYSSVERLLEQERPDFVDIATRPSTHRDLVETVAERGLPILLQKPVAETWDEARHTVDAARAAGVRMMVNENWRWQRWYREIARLMAEGRIGRPFYYSIRTRARDGLGSSPYPNQPYFAQMPRLLVYETLVHHLDTSRFLFGDIEEVYCRAGRINPAIAGEDLAAVSTRHAGGLIGTIDGNRATAPEEPGPALETASFEGEDGCLRLRHSGDVWLDGERVFAEPGSPGYRGDSCRATQQHFADCVASGAEFETEASDYLRKTFAAVEACYRSARENRPVRLAEIAGEA